MNAEYTSIFNPFYLCVLALSQKRYYIYIRKRKQYLLATYLYKLKISILKISERILTEFCYDLKQCKSCTDVLKMASQHHNYKIYQKVVSLNVPDQYVPTLDVSFPMNSATSPSPPKKKKKNYSQGK